MILYIIFNFPVLILHTQNKFILNKNHKIISFLRKFKLNPFILIIKLIKLLLNNRNEKQ